MRTRKKKIKTKKLYLFAYETDRGYWNTSKSFYESEIAFRAAHNMSEYVRIVKVNVSITVPIEKDKIHKAFDDGYKAAKFKDEPRFFENDECPF